MAVVFQDRFYCTSSSNLFKCLKETPFLLLLFQVETVGDVYVLVSGLPVRIGDRHVVEVVNCALDLISGILAFDVPHKPGYKMKLRIGTRHSVIDEQVTD